MSKKCIGCGIKLQSDSELDLGYIIESRLNDSSYCQRCYKMMNYNEVRYVKLNNNKKAVLNRVNEDKEHVFFLIDFLSINTETINTFKEIKSIKTLIISKLDLIPSSFNFNKIKNWLKETYKIKDNIIFVSSLKNKNISKIFSILDDLNIKTTYFMGYTNAGKSTLLNTIINDNNKKINTSCIPNTTLDFIKIKCGDYTLIDTPGFELNYTIYKENDFSLMKKIVPKKFIKPYNFQLKKDASIVFENKFRLTNLDDINSFTSYISNQIDVKKVYETNDYLKEFELKTYHVNKNNDIIIKGLGFINIKKECDVNIYIENHNLIEIRKSFLGSEYYE